MSLSSPPTPAGPAESPSLWAAMASIELAEKIAHQYASDSDYAVPNSPVYSKVGYINDWADCANPSLYTVQIADRPILRMLPEPLFAEIVQAQIYKTLLQAILADAPLDQPAWGAILLAAADRSLPAIRRDTHEALRRLSSSPTVLEMALLAPSAKKPNAHLTGEDDLGTWGAERWIKLATRQFQASIGRSISRWTDPSMASSLAIQGDTTMALAEPVSIPLRVAPPDRSQVVGVAAPERMTGPA